jgi:hypothetical protein
MTNDSTPECDDVPMRESPKPVEATLRVADLQRLQSMFEKFLVLNANTDRICVLVEGRRYYLNWNFEFIGHAGSVVQIRQSLLMRDYHSHENTMLGEFTDHFRRTLPQGGQFMTASRNCLELFFPVNPFGKSMHVVIVDENSMLAYDRSDRLVMKEFRSSDGKVYYNANKDLICVEFLGEIYVFDNIKEFNSKLIRCDEGNFKIYILIV